MAVGPIIESFITGVRNMIDIKGLKCPNCGANIADIGAVCDYCGSRILLSDDPIKPEPAGILCPDCGENNALTAGFCNKCGAELPCESPAGAEGMPIGTVDRLNSRNDDSNRRREQVDRELNELEKADWLLNYELNKVENPGRFIAPTILSMFAVWGICVAFADSGTTVGLLIFAFFGVPAIGLFGYQFSGRKEEEIQAIKSEIAKVQDKIAAHKKENPESG